MKPNIVGKDMIDAMSTNVAPLLIFLGSEVFNQTVPNTPNPIISNPKRVMNGNPPKPKDHGPLIIIQGPIIVVLVNIPPPVKDDP